MHKHTGRNNPDPSNKYYVGKKLIDKNISDWDIISINETQAIYGTGWNYIEAGTKIEDYGVTNSNWLVNYETGEIIELEENKYVELSSSEGLAVSNGLVFNIDSKNMNTSDLSTWGDGVRLYGFDNTTSDVISLDGVDDYIEFQAVDNFEDGFTISYYGVPKGNDAFFVKQRERNTAYSCRFFISNKKLQFNTSKNRANSNWSRDDGNDNGLLIPPNTLFETGELVSLDLKFEPLQNKFSLYRNGIFQESTIVDNGYWNDSNGGKQVFEDTLIKCYIGRFYGGSPSRWRYTSVDIYSLRLYNRPLTDTEISQNYNKNIAYHNLNQ